MDLKRVWYSLNLWRFKSAKKRADYLRKHHVYGAIGEGCSFQSRKVPLYANLIRIGDKVQLAGNISFLTHDVTHTILNRWKGTNELRENAGCIEIGNNVYIGSKVVIMSNVKIGDNVIISPGSVVESDIPSDCLAGGYPAKVLCPLNMLYSIRKMQIPYPETMKLKNGDFATEEAAKYLWEQFDKSHNSQNRKQ